VEVDEDSPTAENLYGWHNLVSGRQLGFPERNLNVEETLFHDAYLHSYALSK
jgi:hypothetical protein